MQGGFTFCGVDVAKYGLTYAPEIANTFVFGNSTMSPNDEKFASHDGGVYYGTSVDPKDFSLRCFFEEKHINKGILDSIHNFFYPGRTGRLVFQERDWCWYTATVVNIDASDLTNYMNGVITINFRAYYPYARTDIFYSQAQAASGNDSSVTIDTSTVETDTSNLSGTDSWLVYDAPSAEEDIAYMDIGEDVNKYTDINGNVIESNDPYINSKAVFMSSDSTPPSSFTNITETKKLILYNAGNTKAAVAIKLSGEAGTEGVTIKNLTTNQEAKFVAFTRNSTTSANKFILSDGLNGKTTLTDGSTSIMQFLYHDHGFIDLAPSYQVMHGITWTYKKNSNTVSSDTDLDETCIGKYIYVDSEWHKILAIPSSRTAEIAVSNKAISANGSCKADVITMNEIEIEIEDNTELDTIQFIYKHTFR